MDSSNERTDKVYEIIVRQQSQISGNESKIDSFIEQHENIHEWMGAGLQKRKKKDAITKFPCICQSIQ